MEEFQKQLHEWFEYRDGVLYWKQRPALRTAIGSVAGYCCTAPGKNPRWKIMFKGRNYLRSALVWQYFHSDLPPAQIDHADRDSLNDRIENLRPATRAEQQYNTRVRSKGGWKGVYRSGKKWRSKVSIDGIEYCLGVYSTPQEAATAYNLAVWTYFPDFANYNQGEDFWF